MSFQSKVYTPPVDSTLNLQSRDVVGNKSDAAVTTVGTTASSIAYIKGILNTVLGIGVAQTEVVVYGPQTVDVDNTGHFEATLVDKDVGLVPSANITPGTFQLKRVRLGVSSDIGAVTAFSKANGRVYADITFATANWATDDAFQVVPQGDTSYIVGTTTLYPPIPTMSGIISDIATLEGKVDTVIATNGSGDSSGTLSLLDDGTKQTVVELVTAVRKIVCGVWLDCTNLTQIGTIGIEYKVDGSNYKIVTTEPFDPATMEDAQYIDLNMGITSDFKVTYQAGVLEGSAKDIPFSLVYEIKE